MRPRREVLESRELRTLASELALALQDAGVQVTKVTNNNVNVGISPTLALALAIMVERERNAKFLAAEKED